MSGTDDSSDKMECQYGNCDPIDELVAAVAGLSLNAQRRPTLRAARNQGLKKTIKVPLSRLPETISGKSPDVQVRPPKRRWDDVCPEEDVWAGAKRLSVLGCINQEEPEPNVAREEEKPECESTEKAEKEVKEVKEGEAEKEVEEVKAKPRRGGVTHRCENNCCPVLPSSRPLPASHRDLQMEDLRAMGLTLCPRSYWI